MDPLTTRTTLGLVVALVLGAPACGALEGWDRPAGAVGVIRGHLQGDPLALRPATAGPPNLRVGLVWGDDPDTDPFCTEHGRNLLVGPGALLTDAADVGCADTLRFVPSRLVASVAVDARPDAPFALELAALPAADDLRGYGFDRIVYGSLVLWDDIDGSGTLEVVRARRIGRGHDGPDHDEREHGAIAYTPADPESDDVVYGATFLTMTAPHARIVYQEGGANYAFNYYPTPGCSTPPAGFSIAHVTPGLPRSTCRFEALATAEVDLPLRAPPELRDLRCGLPRSMSDVRPGGRGPLPQGLARDCLGAHGDPAVDAAFDQACAMSCISPTELAIADRRAACPGVLHFDLWAGDQGDSTPLRPDWWSCDL